MGPNNPSAETIVQNIRGIEEFLNDHMIDIVMGVINKGDKNGRSWIKMPISNMGHHPMDN